MNELKYIIIIPKGMNQKGARAIIFNGHITHDEVEPPGCKVHSAGFCYLKLNKNTGRIQVKCYGESESIGIKSDSIFDQQIIALTLTRNLPTIGIYL